MIRVEIATVIDRPIDEVFARLTDLSSYSRWMPKLDLFIRSDQISPGPMGVGTTYFDKVWMGTYRGEVVEFSAPTRVAFREILRWMGVRVAEARATYQLHETPAGTEVHHVGEGQFFGAFRVMTPLGAWIAGGERKRTIGALKESLEGGK